ncbi:MAG: hypothetical protein ND866_25870, partial [Pyrinomonadaceae bacterium]|nr:hypothetical protein [Pyrinomonadaceae bacterium]
ISFTEPRAVATGSFSISHLAFFIWHFSFVIGILSTEKVSPPKYPIQVTYNRTLTHIRSSIFQQMAK